MPKCIYSCPVCLSIFERYASTVRDGVTPFCSKKCYAKHMPSMFAGSKNPNYGKIWNADQRTNLSNKVKERFKDPAERLTAGNANRGKKFSKERIAKMHAHRSSDSYARIPSKERKIAIGIQSAKNWTNEQFRHKVISGGIKTRERKGLIIPRALLTEWQIYWRLANWIRVYNYAPGIELGKNGLCRDHMVSRK